MADLNYGKPKRILEANTIAVGGMIALGKSTLVDGLTKYYAKYKAKSIYELSSSDPLQDLLLEGLYNRTVSPEVFQLYFVTRRFEAYKKAIQESERGQPLFFDRTIFEDRLFAHQNMMDRPIQFTYYDKLWNDLVNELIYLIGTPRIYIVLDSDFETFKERLFARNRKVEVDNWNLNIEYFKALHNAYIPFMEGVCKFFGIRLCKINVSNKDIEAVQTEAIKCLEEILGKDWPNHF